MDVAGEKEVSWFGVMLDGQKLKKKRRSSRSASFYEIFTINKINL